MTSIPPPPELAYDSILGPSMGLAPAEVDEEVQEASDAMPVETEEPVAQCDVVPAKKIRKKIKGRSYES